MQDFFFEHVMRWKSFFSLLGHIYFFGQNPQEYYFVINNSWGNFFGFAPVKVYERVRKSVTSVCKKNQGLKDASYGCEKSRKQVLFSDLFIFKRRCINRDTETTVILSEFTCKIVFTKKNSRIGLYSQVILTIFG